MPIISNTEFCIDRRKIEFSLIEKNVYKDELFNNKLSKLKRKLNPFLKNIIFFRKFVQCEVMDFRDTLSWEAYPQGNKNYIFICVAKVASSSINKILNHNLHPEPRFHHMGIKEFKKYYPYLDIDKFYKFAFVRNPWARFLSLYNDMTLERNGKNKLMNYSLLTKKYNTIFYMTKNFKEFAKAFESSDWINEAHFKPQSDFLTLNDKIYMDFIGKYENLEKDWQKVKADLGIKHISNLGHQRQTKAKINSYKDYYDNETIDIVSRIYKKDIDLFGYDF